MLSHLKLFILSAVLVHTSCFKYTLPGDAKWPNATLFAALKNSIRGKVALRGDLTYAPHTWNNITNTPKPAVIVQPSDSSDVVTALRFAQTYNIRVSVQSTGHHQDHRNIYDNSIHLDMSTMNAKSLNLTARTLTLGPGNNFSQIQAFVAEQTGRKLVALSGADPGVGIYGWTVGGGHGFFTRMYGLGVDALISIDIVLANQSLVTASATQNPDLFRALRGSGGPAYGVAVSLTVRLYDDPGAISTFTGAYELSSSTAATFADWMIGAPNEVRGYYLPSNFGPDKGVLVAVTCSANTSFCAQVFTPLKVGCIVVPAIGASCAPVLDRYASFYEFFKGDDGAVY